MSLQQQYGPWALITGASSGIGEAFAHELAKAGLNLLISARNHNKLNQLAAQLEQQHAIKVEVCCADLSQASQQQALIQQAQNLPLGLIVANAGFGAKGEFLAESADFLNQMYQTNCLANSQIAHQLLPQLQQQQRGGIIFTGSVEGEVPFPYSSAYAASKAFVHSLANGLWLEMKPYKVDVLLLAPGSTDTQAPIKQGMTKAQLIGLLAPATVAQQALKALGKKRQITPGLINQSYSGLFKLLPRGLAIRLAGWGLQKAIRDAKAAQTTQ